MKKIFIYSKNVCERRKLDAQKIAEYVSKNGDEIVTHPNHADIIILSTCGATGECSDISFQDIHHFSQYPAELIITGCLPATDKKEFDQVFLGTSIVTKELDAFDTVFPKYAVEFHSLDDANRPWDSENKKAVIPRIRTLVYTFDFTKNLYLFFITKILGKLLGNNLLLLEGDFSFLQNEYYYITTSWGCSQNCSYCGTRFAVGSFHSKPLETCVKELQTGLKKGFTKFVIEGDDIGGYGKDIGKTLVDLLDELTKIKAKYSITITAINPVWLIKNSKKLMKIFSRGKITCLNIPFQSGNQRILRLMNRYAQVEQMIQLIKDIKHACPDMKIGTHCIIGFPSETLDEFQDTLEFIIKANFDMGLVNLMSVKDGTEAEHLTPKIPFEEIMRRKQLTQRFLKKNGYKVFSTEKKVIFG